MCRTSILSCARMFTTACVHLSNEPWRKSCSLFRQTKDQFIVWLHISLIQIKACTASRMFTTVFPLIRIAVQCNIYYPSVEEIRSNLPKTFREHFPIVRGVLDCTEIQTQLPKCLNCKSSGFSGYKQTNTTHFLICMTPAGTMSYVSSGYSGKSSDKFIFNNEKIIEKFEVGMP